MFKTEPDGLHLDEVVPGPTTVSLGGVGFPVWEATLADLADLQRWLRSTRPDPMLRLTRLLDDPGLTPSGRDALIAAAYEEAGSWPPRPMSDEGRRLLATPEGLSFFLYLALRRGTPGLTPAGAVGAFASVTSAHELLALERAFYGVDSARTLKQMAWAPEVLALLGRGPGRGMATWDKVLYEVADALKVPLREVYAMTLTEVGLVLRGGEPPPGGDVRVPPHMVRRVEELQAKHLGVPAPSRPEPAPEPPAAVDPPGLVPGARYGGGPAARAAWEARFGGANGEGGS